jgi:hypothetical protein
MEYSQLIMGGGITLLCSGIIAFYLRNISIKQDEQGEMLTEIKLSMIKDFRTIADCKEIKHQIEKEFDSGHERIRKTFDEYRKDITKENCLIINNMNKLNEKVFGYK